MAIAPLLVLLGTLARCGPAPAPAGDGAAPAPAPAGVSLPPPINEDPEPVADLLDRLEGATADLRDFQADITYWKWDSVIGRRETRQGEVIYQVRPDEGDKRFAILLERQIIGNRATTRRKHYIFEGSWLVEIDPEEKMFIKRQIVPPGQRFDPLKLGEGPFPLPIGQPKDEVLARFEVERLDRPLDETLAQRLSNAAVEGLRLVPRPGTAAEEEFEQVELFYDRDTLLPVGVSATETNGNRKTIVLLNLKRNAGVDESKLSVETPDPREGWRIDVLPWQN